MSGPEPRKEAPLIESFLTTYRAGFGGGGCDNDGSNTNALEIRTYVVKLHLERERDTLKVNGKELPTGNEFSAANLFTWNPWIITRLRFNNMGVVADCDPNTSNERIVIAGSYGSEFSLAKGLLSLSIFIGGLVFVTWNLKKLRDNEKSRGINAKEKRR